MKQYTTAEQTAKLIELGFEKPKSEVKAEQARDYAWDVPEEIECDDVTCMIFWDTYDGIVGKGSTPERAMADLVAKMDKALETE